MAVVENQKQNASKMRSVFIDCQSGHHSHASLIKTLTKVYNNVSGCYGRLMLSTHTSEWLRERTEHLDIFLFPSITHWCSISDVLFTGGRGVSDFSVLKYY